MALLSNHQILFLDEPRQVGCRVSVCANCPNLKGRQDYFSHAQMDEAAEMCERVEIINRGKIVALDSPDNLSITAGRVYLIDANFDKSVSPEALTKLPGVNRLETAQAIEAADKPRRGDGGAVNLEEETWEECRSGCKSPAGTGESGMAMGKMPGPKLAMRKGIPPSDSIRIIRLFLFAHLLISAGLIPFR
jgi:ABC-2 type transport system ATP-binding protein